MCAYSRIQMWISGSSPALSTREFVAFSLDLDYIFAALEKHKIDIHVIRLRQVNLL